MAIACISVLDTDTRSAAPANSLQHVSTAIVVETFFRKGFSDGARSATF